MSGSNGVPKKFRVGRTAAVLAQVEERYREAEESGRDVEFVAAMRYIFTTLRTHPREFGEPLWTLPHARLTIRVGASSPVSVRYAVHETAYEVLLLQVDLMAAGD